MEKWLRKNKRPLIEPDHSTPRAKEAKGNTNKKWDSMQRVFQTELDKIVGGEDMPISRSTMTIRDGDPRGMLIVMNCSDNETDDDEDKTDRRKRGKRNRQVKSLFLLYFMSKSVGRQTFREDDGEVNKVIELFRVGTSAAQEVQLGLDLRKEIEQVFLSPDATDPESDLMKTICPPRNFPYDLAGKQQKNLLPLLKQI